MKAAAKIYRGMRFNMTTPCADEAAPSRKVVGSNWATAARRKILEKSVLTSPVDQPIAGRYETLAQKCPTGGELWRQVAPAVAVKLAAAG